MAANEKNLAHSIGLHQVNTEVAIEEVAYDMLFTMYKTNPRDPAEQLRDFERFLPAELSAKDKEKELKSWAEFTDVGMNKKIEQVFEQWTNGSKWMDTGDKVKSMLLLGPPGQGKTTTFKEAARKVSSALGLTFKQNPGDHEQISPRDFLLLRYSNCNNCPIFKRDRQVS